MALVAREVAADEELALFGFPTGRPTGVWKRDIRRAGPLVGAWQQLIGRGPHDYKLQAGFSGCPIMTTDGAVVGIFAQADAAIDVDAGAEIPIPVAVDSLYERDHIRLTVEPDAAPRGGPDTGQHELPTRRPGALPAAWNVPALRNPNFTGREGELSAIAEALRSFGLVALTGLGGVGKSQLAVQYAHRHIPTHQPCWWIRAEEAAGIVSDLAALAVLLDLVDANSDQPRAAAAAQRWLGQNAGWMLVFDNAPNPRAVRPWLPAASTGAILITSRDAGWGGTAKVIPVAPLDSRDAACLLLRRTRQDNSHAAQTLGDRLGGLPLALEQAGAYMEITGTSLNEYLGLYETRRKELLAFPGEPDAQTVTTTWQLAFQHLAVQAPLASALLRTAAYLAPDDIPRELFVGNDLLPDTLRGLADPLGFGEALAALAGHSLVTLTGDGFSVHRLVQAVTRDQQPAADTSEWATAAITTLHSAVSFDAVDIGTWDRMGRLVAHVQQACDLAERADAALGTVASLLNTCGRYFHLRGQFTQAQTVLETALRLAEATSASEDAAIAAILVNLGAVCRARGDLARAQAVQERAIAIDEALFGPDHPEVATDLNNLGTTLQTQGEHDRAEALLTRALSIDEGAYGANHPQVAVRLSNLGNVLISQGRLGDAEEVLLRALDIFESSLGPDHPQIAAPLAALGGARRARGDLAGAKRATERALAVEEAALGRDHPLVGISVANLGVILRDLGDIPGATAAYGRALSISVSAFGKDHEQTRQLQAALDALK